MEYFGKLRNNITRKKIVTPNLHTTPLARCLSTLDLSFIAVGCMLGSGVYFLPGEVIGNMAGPAALISFAIAGAYYKYYPTRKNAK